MVGLQTQGVWKEPRSGLGFGIGISSNCSIKTESQGLGISVASMDLKFWVKKDIEDEVCATVLDFLRTCVIEV
jgi:hypothetical protein